MEMIERHFAFFDRVKGCWLGEWRGVVPSPDIPLAITGDARLGFMDQWQQRVTQNLHRFKVDAAIFDQPAFDACPKDGAVCLDVTRFGWPVGDHIWHKWNDVDRFLDWGDDHTFIEIDTGQRQIVANQKSHRPIRSSQGRCIIDITGTALASYYGSIFGTLEKGSKGWMIRPHEYLPVPVQRAISGAVVPLPLTELTAPVNE